MHTERHMSALPRSRIKEWTRVDHHEHTFGDDFSAEKKRQSWHIHPLEGDQGSKQTNQKENLAVKDAFCSAAATASADFPWRRAPIVVMTSFGRVGNFDEDCRDFVFFICFLLRRAFGNEECYYYYTEKEEK